MTNRLILICLITSSFFLTRAGFSTENKTTAHMIIDAESSIIGVEPNYGELDEILNDIKQKTQEILTENPKLNRKTIIKVLKNIHLMLEYRGFRFKTTDLLSEAVNYCKDESCYYSDCDTNSYIYYTVLSDLLGQKISLISRWKHMYIRWYLPNNSYVNWETTSGFQISEYDYYLLFKSRAIDELKTQKQVLSSVYYTQGITNNMKKEYSKAVEFLNTAIELAPEASKYYNERGVANYRMNKLEDSITDYTKAVELNPEEIAYYSNRGISYYMLGDNQKAILDFTKAIELNPKEATYYGNRGISYYILGEQEKAITDFSSALNIAPNNAEYYAGRGACYYLLGKYRKTIYDMSMAIELQPNNHNYYYIRGMAYEAINKTIEASLDKSRASNLEAVSSEAAEASKAK